MLPSLPPQSDLDREDNALPWTPERVVREYRCQDARRLGSTDIYLVPIVSPMISLLRLNQATLKLSAEPGPLLDDKYYMVEAKIVDWIRKELERLCGTPVKLD